MKKTTIENSIIDFPAQLEDAAQSFQIATLIDIHYAVSSRVKEQHRSIISEPLSPPLPYRLNTTSSSQSRDSPKSSVTESRSSSLALIESPIEMEEEEKEPVSLSSPSASDAVVGEPEEEEIISDDVLDAHGGTKLTNGSPSSVGIISGRSNLKGGWWAGASPAEVEGRPTLVKRYEQALKAWLTDVKLLQNVFHPSLPQMVGLSEGGTPTSFILLSNVQTRTPQALLLETLKKDGLAACADLILHFYQDVVDAAIYIQRQRELTDHELQDFVGDASFRVDGSSTMIMGLPRPRQGRWFTARNYGLTESLTMAIMSMLPKGGTLQHKREDDIDNGEPTRQISHLVTLTKGLLPADKAPIRLSPRVQALIGGHDDDEDEDDFYRTPKRPKLDLRQLRLSNLDADTHDHESNREHTNSTHHTVVGTPIEARSSEATAIGPTVVIKGKYIQKFRFNYDNTNNSGSTTESYETVKSGSYTLQTFNGAVTSQARTLSESGSIQIEPEASYGPVSAKVQPRFTTNKEVSSFLKQTTRGQNERSRPLPVETFTSKESRTRPGMTTEEPALRTTPTPLPADQLVEEVPIKLNGKQTVMMEINTASCVGFLGISDAFGAALWGIDYAFQMAVNKFGFAMIFAMIYVGGETVFSNPFNPPPTTSDFRKWTVGPMYYTVTVAAESIGPSNVTQVLDLGANGGNDYTPAYAFYENGNPMRVRNINYVTDPTGASDLHVQITMSGSGIRQSSVQVR
ncbi:hypothetical protein DXG01_000534 [Tephrocybe rancida]|nr:hypothetical protein DXG01_000534 [Tephrocybe rancida]